MPKYKTLRIREEDYDKLREIRRALRRRGTENLDWELLRQQDLIEVPEDSSEEEEEGSGDFTWGLLVGLGAAALAYFLLKGGQRR